MKKKKHLYVAALLGAAALLTGCGTYEGFEPPASYSNNFSGPGAFVSPNIGDGLGRHGGADIHGK